MFPVRILLSALAPPSGSALARVYRSGIRLDYSSRSTARHGALRQDGSQLGQGRSFVFITPTHPLTYRGFASIVPRPLNVPRPEAKRPCRILGTASSVIFSFT
eukprot:6605408-Pyramimonas_sp.AAC.1